MAETGNGLPHAAPSVALFPEKLCTGDLLSFNCSADSLGQFEATIINSEDSESEVLQDCLTPT